jgi:hypothetical protein
MNATQRRGTISGLTGEILSITLARVVYDVKRREEAKEKNASIALNASAVFA